MFITWWIGLTLTTPLYTPYARLSLPWLVSSWVLVGGFFSLLLNRSGPQPWKGLTVLGVLGLVMATGFFGRPVTHAEINDSAINHVWGDRTSLRKATVQILHETEMGCRDMPPSQAPGCDYAIYVVGEPALFCHLTQQSAATIVTKPASSVPEAAAPHRSGPAFPKFIVTGSHVNPAEIETAKAAGRIEEVWQQRVLVSDLVALDSANWGQLQQQGDQGAERPDRTIPIRIFRIRD